MGRRGPRPTPSPILALRGTLRRDRRRDEPEPPTGRPACPDELQGEARKEFYRLTREMESIGVLAKSDRGAITLWCRSWAQHEEASAKIAATGLVVKSPNGFAVLNPYLTVQRRAAEVLLRLAREFGLTPSARASVRTAPPPADTANPKSKFFAKHG